ncbi:CoB--CoM heterodisulfide reductase iron-sulfur subunit B family protein [Metallumcola ferriviriculae]|uniref:CoB--CoM heterodisulfide reductase iron-sulfur subunit B family protein n=1 Tax=Metallumcola ferriviriculae TaxID=3039180 RepID=A0AAU0URY9_9FIRM|nr:CoB--CoM heterodisulfide reductase iron-sulfur subunit B family protein [Desulfitibacteraceae bacterium MK1]
MKYALFLGCSIPVRVMGYEKSARAVAEKLGLEFVDVDGFRCCGYPVKALDHYTSLLLAARNLALAEEAGLEICTLCNACSGSLLEADIELKEDEALRNKINEDLKKLGLEYKGTTKVKHFLRIIEELAAAGEVPELEDVLAKSPVAAHYGCHFTKPTRAYNHYYGEDLPSQALDNLIGLVGAESTDYSGKDGCCGGGLLALRQDYAGQLSAEKVTAMVEAGAKSVVVTCPTCGMMLSNNQEEDDEFPVIYFPQLLGLALGIDPDDLGFELNSVDAEDWLEELGVG